VKAELDEVAKHLTNETWDYTNSFYNCLMLIPTVPKLHNPFGSCSKAAVYLQYSFLLRCSVERERESWIVLIFNWRKLAKK